MKGQYGKKTIRKMVVLENLFSGKTEYEHLGNKVRMPSIEEFSESWMGSISEKDKSKVRKHFKDIKSILDM